MGKSKYIVKLSVEEQKKLKDLVHRGKHQASVQTRARLLLKAHEGATDTAIRAMLGVGMPTIWRLKRLYLSSGLEAALKEHRGRKAKPVKVDGRVEASLIQLACSAPPEGRARWTVRLLGTRLVELEVIPSIGKTTVHQVLKKMHLRLIKRSSG